TLDRWPRPSGTRRQVENGAYVMRVRTLSIPADLSLFRAALATVGPASPSCLGLGLPIRGANRLEHHSTVAKHAFVVPAANRNWFVQRMSADRVHHCFFESSRYSTVTRIAERKEILL